MTIVAARHLPARVRFARGEGGAHGRVRAWRPGAGLTSPAGGRRRPRRCLDPQPVAGPKLAGRLRGKRLAVQQVSPAFRRPRPRARAARGPSLRDQGEVDRRTRLELPDDAVAAACSPRRRCLGDATAPGLAPGTLSPAPRPACSACSTSPRGWRSARRRPDTLPVRPRASRSTSEALTGRQREVVHRPLALRGCFGGRRSASSTRSATRLDVSTFPAATAPAPGRSAGIPRARSPRSGERRPPTGGASGSVRTRTAKNAADFVTGEGAVEVALHLRVRAREVERQPVALDPGATRRRMSPSGPAASSSRTSSASWLPSGSSASRPGCGAPHSRGSRTSRRGGRRRRGARRAPGAAARR